MAKANVRYRQPLRFDDEFDAVVSVERLGDTSFVIAIELQRDGETTTEGTLRYVVIESGGGAKTSIPGPIRTALADYAPVAS